MALLSARHFLNATDSVALGNIKISTSNISNISFHFRMKLDASAVTDSTSRNILSKQTNNADQFYLRKIGSNLSVRLQYATWVGVFLCDMAIDTDWHSYLFTWSASTDRGILYKDGVITSNSVSSDVGYLDSGNNSNGFLGADSTMSAIPGAALCDVGIWKVTLTAANALSLAGGAGCDSIPSGLSYSIPLQGSSPEATNAGGSITGTVVGTTVVDGPDAPIGGGGETPPDFLVPIEKNHSLARARHSRLFSPDKFGHQSSMSLDVIALNPLPGSTGVPVNTVVSATFNKSIDIGTLSFVLTDSNNVVVPSVISYDDATHTVILTPTSTSSNLFSLWDSTYVPAIPSFNDTTSIEVGVKFTSDTDGYVIGVRFYKGASNLGTHVGHLWKEDGTMLSEVTFANETETGWQEMEFASPVAITANTIYIASYSAPQGGYAADAMYFVTDERNSLPLHALSSPASGGNGVYTYGPSGSFPLTSFNSTNYWVDVVFRQ